MPSTLLHAGSEEELTSLLKENGVDPEEFGKGEAKTLAHLLKEIHEGECSLWLTEDGTIKRVVNGACVDVFYKNQHLKEDRQEFKDGRVRVRDIITSIGEKLQPGEDPRLAAQRALEEELGIKEELDIRYQEDIVKALDFSQSYPGLHTRYEMKCFWVELPEAYYKPEGYVEHQADKSTYWVWTQK
jgi:hypothetical protein